MALFIGDHLVLGYCNNSELKKWDKKLATKMPYVSRSMEGANGSSQMVPRKKLTNPFPMDVPTLHQVALGAPMDDRVVTLC